MIALQKNMAVRWQNWQNDFKRRCFVAAFLLESGFKINCSEEELYNFTIDISTGKLKFDDIFLWLKNNTQSL